VAFDQSGPRWLGISDVIAEPEGPTFISYKVARSRLDRLRFVTQDPTRTSECLDLCRKSLTLKLSIGEISNEATRVHGSHRWRSSLAGRDAGAAGHAGASRGRTVSGIKGQYHRTVGGSIRQCAAAAWLEGRAKYPDRLPLGGK
jgi:hypothetical protein